MTQPGSLASFVAARYTFGEHSVIGTSKSIETIQQTDLIARYKRLFAPSNAVVTISGDISHMNAFAITKSFFGSWNGNPYAEDEDSAPWSPLSIDQYRKQMSLKPTLKRLFVVDLPDSGQAAVVYAKKTDEDRYNVSRLNGTYFSALVANSLLGGGYSSRMNQEIRIKRGLSYGAGSSIAWRFGGGNFSTRCQTKTVSAAEVAELTIKEIDRLVNESATDAELTPRKNVVTGEFGRSFETNDGISGQIQDLLTFGLDFNKLDTFAADTSKVTAEQVKDFALFNLKGGDIIIVGDYRDFKDDLAKRFPNQNIEVIKLSELDLNSDTLRKAK